MGFGKGVNAHMRFSGESSRTPSANLLASWSLVCQAAPPGCQARSFLDQLFLQQVRTCTVPGGSAGCLMMPDGLIFQSEALGGLRGQ